MLSYCASEVQKYDRDSFLASLFVQATEREGLLAVLALNIELGRIPKLVSEEVIGHVRLAWWQEAIGELYTGHAPRGQPVLMALEPVIAAGRLSQESLATLLDAYRENYPDTPPQLDQIVDTIVSLLLTDDAGWRKARQIIATHRRRHSTRMNVWLSIKLLLAGM